MRILQLIQKKQLRGAEIFATLLSQHLHRQGHETSVLALLDGNGDMPSEERIGILNARPDHVIDLIGWFRLARIIRRWKPDVVQANAGDTLRYAIISKLVFRWRPPVVFRNASVMSRYLGHPVKRWAYQRILNRVQAVASVSETSRRDILQLFPRLRDRVEVIPVGVEPGMLDTASPAASTEGPFILHVGGFTFEKNHAGLLRICALIWKKYPDMKLLLAGEGPLMPEIRKAVVRMGAEQRVVFLGSHRDIGCLMQNARLLLLPSIIEGLPGVVLEAMYCRLPVIAYDVGGVGEVITSGVHGWLVETGDEEGFAQKVIEVLQMPGMAESVKGPAHTLVRNHFMNTRIAERFAHFYATTASGV